MRRGRDWLLRSRWSLRLTPFPSARRRGPCKPTAQKAVRRHLLFSHLRLQVNLRQRYKNKRYRFLDTFLLRDLAEREGFEPPEPRSSTVFKTAAIDHSATSPKDKSIAFFSNHQIFLKIFFIHQTPSHSQLSIGQRITAIYASQKILVIYSSVVASTAPEWLNIAIPLPIGTSIDDGAAVALRLQEFVCLIHIISIS